MSAVGRFAGAGVGVIAGTAVGGAIGAGTGVLESVSLATTVTKTVKVNKMVNGHEEEIEIPVTKPVVPGLVKTAIWGWVGITLAVAGLGPDHWPTLVQPVTSWVVEHLPNAGSLTQAFLAAAALRPALYVAGGGAIGGGVGAVIGGATGAAVGAGVAETLTKK